MARQKKSLLLNYIHNKHRAEAAGTVFIILIFAVLIFALTGANVASTATATSAEVQYFNSVDVQKPITHYPLTGVPMMGVGISDIPGGDMLPTETFAQTDDVSSTGLASGSGALSWMWILALFILVPIEIVIRKV